MIAMRATGLGRDSIFCEEVESSYDLTLVCRAAVALGAKGFALPGGFRFERGHPTLEALDVKLIQNDDEGAIVFEAETPRGQDALRACLASLDLSQPLPVILKDAITGVGEVGVDPMTGSDRMRLYGIGGSDLVNVRRITKLLADKRGKTLVFMVGMIGQDLADQLGSLLGVGRVVQNDLPSGIMHALIRYRDFPEALSRVLLVIANEVSPVENTAIHLVLGPQ